MGEVQNTQHGENQGKPQRRKRVDRAEEKAVGYGLRYLRRDVSQLD